MFKLTEEEEVYAKQLYDVRKKMAVLEVEMHTQADRLSSILRSHQSRLAESPDGYLISSVIIDSREAIIISHHGRLPHEM